MTHLRPPRRPWILRLVLLGLLGGSLLALPWVLRVAGPSVGADTAVAARSQPPVPVPGSTRAAAPDSDDPERRLAEAIGQARESVVALEYATATTEGPSARRMATGVVIGDAGEVLSIRIDPPPSDAPVMARDASGRRHPAEWVASDVETGLTLLRIKPGLARPIRAAAHAPRLGGQVFVIGNPFGLGHSVLRGHISGLDRRLELGPRQLGGLIQLAVAVHPGDSGALVANLQGEWLGLIRSGLALPVSRRGRNADRDRDRDREHDHDLGFAIPARDALWVAEQLRLEGRVDRAYLGVRIDPGATNDPPGAVLYGVLDGSPASHAGLDAGDRIVALNGHTIASPGDLTDQLDRTRAGTEVLLDVLRGARTEHRTVRTVSRPPPAPDSDAKSSPTEAAPPPAPAPPKAEELPPALPRELVERLDRLERRLESLEKRAETTTP
jgi:S1-C subfamily serine protease